jgi:hypothetical protein
MGIGILSRIEIVEKSNQIEDILTYIGCPRRFSWVEDVIFRIYSLGLVCRFAHTAPLEGKKKKNKFNPKAKK